MAAPAGVTACCGPAGGGRWGEEGGRRKERTVSARSLVRAGFVALVTNAPAEMLTAHEGLSAYRFRWQVELLFKRWKQMLVFDRLPGKSEALARTYIVGKLIGALLVEDLWRPPVKDAPQSVSSPNGATTPTRLPPPWLRGRWQFSTTLPLEALEAHR